MEYLITVTLLLYIVCAKMADVDSDEWSDNEIWENIGKYFINTPIYLRNAYKLIQEIQNEIKR